MAASSTTDRRTAAAATEVCSIVLSIDGARAIVDFRPADRAIAAAHRSAEPLDPIVVEVLRRLEEHASHRLAITAADRSGSSGSGGTSAARQAGAEEPMIGTMAVAKILNITDRAVRDLIADRRSFPGATKVKGHWQVPVREVEALALERAA